MIFFLIISGLLIKQVESTPKNRSKTSESRSNLWCVKHETIFKVFYLKIGKKSLKLWIQIGQNDGFPSDLKASKIGSKLWVYRKFTKNYGSEHPPLKEPNRLAAKIFNFTCRTAQKSSNWYKTQRIGQITYIMCGNLQNKKVELTQKIELWVETRLKSLKNVSKLTYFKQS